MKKIRRILTVVLLVVVVLIVSYIAFTAKQTATDIEKTEAVYEENTSS